MRRGLTFKKKKHNRLSVLGITLVVIMFFCTLGVSSIKLEQKRADLLARESELQARLDSETARTQELVELKKYTQTKKYAEEVAKEKLGLVYEDEIIFKPQE